MAISLGIYPIFRQTQMGVTQEKQRMKPVPWIFDVIKKIIWCPQKCPTASVALIYLSVPKEPHGTTLKTIDRTQLCLFLWENRSSEMGQTGQVHNKWWTFQTMSSPQKCTSSVVWKKHHLAVKPLETSNKNGRLGVVERISVASVWSPNQVQTGIICAIQYVYLKAVINIQKTQTVQPKGYNFCSLEISKKTRPRCADPAPDFPGFDQLASGTRWRIFGSFRPRSMDFNVENDGSMIFNHFQWCNLFFFPQHVETNPKFKPKNCNFISENHLPSASLGVCPKHPTSILQWL